MLKHAPKPSIAPSYEPIFDALIQLEAADGIICHLHNSLGRDESILEPTEYADMLSIIIIMLGKSIDYIKQYSPTATADYTQEGLMIEGIAATLKTLRHAYLDLCDRANNRIQMATLYGLILVLGDCMAHLSTHELEGSSV